MVTIFLTNDSYLYVAQWSQASSFPGTFREIILFSHFLSSAQLVQDRYRTFHGYGLDRFYDLLLYYPLTKSDAVFVNDALQQLWVHDHSRMRHPSVLLDNGNNNQP